MREKIPLVDLKAQYEGIKGEVRSAIDEVLEGMQLFLGPQLQALESEFAHYCGSHYGIGLSNGTDALALALRACDIGAGDEVITVANTFIATVEAIALVGARPILVDVNPRTALLDSTQLEQVLTPQTKAIIPVHLYGQPVDMSPVLAVAQAHGLRVIEDASQAHGAWEQGHRVGSIGDIGCFSCYYSKNLGAYGEAGLCVTNDEMLAERIRMLRDHGSRVRYQHELMGTNARMDELQAAILRIKLRYLDAWTAQRRTYAQIYHEHFAGLLEVVSTERTGSQGVYHLYVVQVAARDEVRRMLAEAGIATGIHYPIPLHLQPACQSYGYQRGNFPISEQLAERVLSLPLYAELHEEQRIHVIEAVTQAVQQTKPPIS